MGCRPAGPPRSWGPAPSQINGRDPPYLETLFDKPRWSRHYQRLSMRTNLPDGTGHSFNRRRGCLLVNRVSFEIWSAPSRHVCDKKLMCRSSSSSCPTIITVSPEKSSGTLLFGKAGFASGTSQRNLVLFGGSDRATPSRITGCLVKCFIYVWT